MKSVYAKSKAGSPAVDRRMEGIIKSFGEEVRKARETANLTSAQLGNLIGMKQSLISEIENGKRNLTLYSILALSEKLSIPIDVKFA